MRADAGAFDLSGFKPPATPGYWHAQDASQHDYYFMGCGTVSSLSTPVTCTDSPCTQPAAIQTWGTPSPQPPVFPGDSCAGLGSFPDGKCDSFNNATHQGVSCAFAGGDGGRALTINYICSQAAFTAPTAAQTGMAPGGGDHYVITFTGPAGCIGAGGVGGGGWGTLFLILFPVFVGLYVGGGFGYNYKYRELRGMDAVPQVEYWREVPGLVKDGCTFSYAQTSLFIAWVNEKRLGSPSDAGLKQALASDEEGAAASSTAYEEQK